MDLLVVGFIIGFLTSIPPMGPITAIVIQRTLRRDYLRSVAFGVGSTLSEGLYVLAAVYSVHLMLDEFPVIQTTLEWLGVFILFALGVYFLTSHAAPDEDELERTEYEDTVKRSWTFGKQFVAGFFMSVINPTMIVTWTATIGLIVSVGGFEFADWQMWAFAVAVVLGDAAWFILFNGMMARWGERLSERVIRWIVHGMGALLIVIAVWSGIQYWTGG